MAMQLDLPLERSDRYERDRIDLGRGASFAAGLGVGLFFLLLAALYSFYRLRTA